MKRLLSFFALGVVAVIAIAATVKISDLPLSTSPSTNTYIEIADMSAVTKSAKFQFNGVTYKAVTNGMGWSGDTNNVIGGDGHERTVPTTVTTNFVQKTGDTMTGALRFPDGSLANPSLSFSSATNIGFYLSGSDMQAVAGGSVVAEFLANQLKLSQNLTLNSGVGIYVDGAWLFGDAANTLALRNGANAQTFNIYNTYTDAANYERFSMSFFGNDFYIGAFGAGTGVGRNVKLYGAGSQNMQLNSVDTAFYKTVTFPNDNTYDIGEVGAKPRTLYVGTSVNIAGTTNQVTFGATNSAPVNASTPAKWISVQVSGLTNVYRLPLYE